MTVNTVNITSGPYTGNGLSDQYSYTFRVKDKTQLSVYETDDTGIRTLLTVDTDYTVAGIGDAAGGILTRVAGNLPTDYIWYIRSDYIENQLTAFRSQGAFFPEIHEDQFDHITFLVQQILDTRARSFRLSDEVDLDGEFTIDDDAAERSGLFLAFNADGDITTSLGTGADSGLRTDLASVTNATLGSKLIGVFQSVTGYVGRSLSSWISSRPYHVDDFGASPGASATVNAAAIQAAINATSDAGKGDLLFGGGVYTSNPLIHKRFVVFVGGGVASTELKLADGANADFIVSENFTALTGTNTKISAPVEDSLVPSWFGLSNLQVNGNKANNSSGRGIVWYGPQQIMRGQVMVRDCADDNIYTEDAIAATEFWQGQEEGQFDHVVTRNSGGKGWLFRGPHNCRMGSIHAGYNDDWGFVSEETANYSGSIDNCNVLHTYANGRGSAPAADTGVSLGAIARISTLITDGDNMDISASNVQIGNYRGANLGGDRDGLVISGNNNIITSINAGMWVSSTNKIAVTLSGLRNKIRALTLVTANADNEGVVMSGNGGQIGGLYAEGFTAAGRKAVYLNASSCRVAGEIANCAIGFDLAAAQANNNVDLTIATNAGQLAVSGTKPSSQDIFNIRASGAGQAGRTFSSAQSGTFLIDTNVAGTLVIPHGLLYTPGKYDISATLLQSSPDSTVFSIAFIRINSVDATNVTIGYKITTPAPAGTLARVGIKCRV